MGQKKGVPEEETIAKPCFYDMPRATTPHVVQQRHQSRSFSESSSEVEVKHAAQDWNHVCRMIYSASWHAPILCRHVSGPTIKNQTDQSRSRKQHTSGSRPSSLSTIFSNISATFGTHVAFRTPRFSSISVYSSESGVRLSSLQKKYVRQICQAKPRKYMKSYRVSRL